MLERKRHQFDALLIILWLNLLIIGLLMIYATSHDPGTSPDLFDLNTPFGRQLVWAGISTVALLFILTIAAEFWNTFALPIYVLALIALVLVLFLGSDIKGARAWFSIGGFSFQPAEFAKLGTLLFTASFLTHFRTDMGQSRSQGIAALLLGLPVGLILLQPDAGSALVFSAMLLPMYRAGLPGGFFILLILAGLSLLLPLIFPLPVVLYGILFVALAVLVLRFEKKLMWSGALLLLGISAWFGFSEDFPEVIAAVSAAFFLLFAVLSWRGGQRSLVGFVLILMGLCASLSYSAFFAFREILAPHQRERINVWLNPSECDPRGPLYNVLQSKLAIASGGLEGKGFMQGNITRLNYVPEQTTDFIFCAIGEEQGFFGTFGVILLFTLLVIRLLQVSERQRSEFSRYYGYGLAGIFFIHFTVNIGMTVGLAPVIGIPLPFISYGGSSLLFFTILFAIFLKLDYADR